MLVLGESRRMDAAMTWARRDRCRKVPGLLAVLGAAGLAAGSLRTSEEAEAYAGSGPSQPAASQAARLSTHCTMPRATRHTAATSCRSTASTARTITLRQSTTS